MTPADLSIALDRYDRHLPYFLGLVTPPPGFRYRPLEVGMVPPRRDGVARHRRMLVEHEFDVAETSLASYIMARASGAPFTAIPAFPRRLFSQNHIFVRDTARIIEPRDLAGRRVAIWAFQVTMSVLARGDLQSEYGVPWREVHWVCEHPEELPWNSAEPVQIECARPGTTGAELLLSGEVDAYIDPHPPAVILRGEGGIRRLFQDPVSECVRYHQRRGYYPIMHLLVLGQELADAHPGLPRQLLAGWEAAAAMIDDFYRDPNYTSMPFGLYAHAEQQELLGDRLWTSGLRENRANLEHFIGYLHDQGLIDRELPVESLFHATVIDT